MRYFGHLRWGEEEEPRQLSVAPDPSVNMSQRLPRIGECSEPLIPVTVSLLWLTALVYGAKTRAKV